MDYRGIVAVVLAIAIGAALVIGFAGLAFNNRQLSEVGGEALIAIGGALVGALAGFMAGRSSNGNGKPPRVPDRPPGAE